MLVSMMSETYAREILDRGATHAGDIYKASLEVNLNLVSHGSAT